MKERILYLCEERAISVNVLCMLSGITQSTVNNLVNGRNKDYLLNSFDLDGITEAGYLCSTPMIICNTDDYKSVKPLVAGEVKLDRISSLW